jgi:ABC-type multidrug transport system permease subunit
MKSPLMQLFVARLREFYREPEAIFWVYGFPLILAIGLGFAFRDRKPEPAPVDLVKGTDDEVLRELLTKAGLKVEVHSTTEARERLRTGKTTLIIEPTADGFTYIYDPSQQEGIAARNQAEAAILRWKTGVAAEPRDRPGGGSITEYSDPQSASTRRWETTDAPVSEPGNRYIDFLIPGLMGLNIMGGGLFGVGFVLVDMRVRKLLKRLLATPMRRSDFMLSIVLTRLTMLLPEMGLLLLLAYFGFDVPVRGNLVLLLLVILIGSFTFAGIGLLLASRTSKTETISGLVNLVMLPGWLLSGTFFSSRRFPDAVQPLIQALPLTQLNDALREVMLEGASLLRVSWRLGILVVWGAVPFLLAKRWFRWL